MCVCVCVHARVSSVVSDILQPHVAQQAPLSTEFSRQVYWSGLPFPSPGDLPDPVIMEQIKTQKQCFPRWDEGGVRGDLAAFGLPGCGGHGALPHRPDPAGPRFGSGVSSLLAFQGQRAVSGVWDVEPRARILVLRVAAALKSQNRAPGLLGAAPPSPRPRPGHLYPHGRQAVFAGARGLSLSSPHRCQLYWAAGSSRPVGAWR